MIHQCGGWDRAGIGVPAGLVAVTVCAAVRTGITAVAVVQQLPARSQQPSELSVVLLPHTAATEAPTPETHIKSCGGLAPPILLLDTRRRPAVNLPPGKNNCTP
jgi:hypothetical protein